MVTDCLWPDEAVTQWFQGLGGSNIILNRIFFRTKIKALQYVIEHVELNYVLLLSPCTVVFGEQKLCVCLIP